MKNISRFLWIFIWLYSCSSATKDTREILIAHDNFDEFTRYQIDFRLLTDSTFIFTYNSSEWSHERKEIFRGRYFVKYDTIYFHPFDFSYIRSDKAILKGDFIEFLNGDKPLKMRLRETVLKSIVTYDTTKYSDYAFFTFDADFYGKFSNGSKSIDLNANELKLVDSLLNVCLKDNSIKRELKDYYKQCISVVDSSNEKVVWINLLCKGRRRDTTYQHYVTRVHDGGECYLNLKINVDTLKYYQLYINGDA
jgi:hypothetical protein